MSTRTMTMTTTTMRPLQSSATTIVALLLLLMVLLTEETTTANMNSRPYTISNPNHQSSKKYSTEYDKHNNDNDNKSEYFDVYSPLIKTRYSEVYWKFQDLVRLPEDIIQRFQQKDDDDNKVIAITGYEVDQVRIVSTTNDQTGEVVEETEESVPITWAYNHHYMAFLVNKEEEEEGRQNDNDNESYQRFHQEFLDNFHNHSYQWITDSDNDEFSKNEFFSEGNGGEFRSSYHGYPKGYAQLIQSPDHFHFSPMQIDTWNRSSLTPLYHPGPLPKSSRIPHSAGYSGLIECPCSDRIDKEWNMAYSIIIITNHDDCSAKDGPIANATECLTAARAVVPSKEYRVSSATVGDAKNCSIVPREDGSVDVLWNTHHDHETQEDSPPALVAFSSQQINMTVVLDKTTNQATIIMTGPSNVWFGAGFGASSMCVHMVSDECPEGGPYAIIVEMGEDADNVVVVERRLDPHGPGHELDSSSLTVVSNTVHGGNRTVVLTRPLQGATAEHFTFDRTQDTLDIIAARGCHLEFAQHCGHGASSLFFLEKDKETPLCRAGIQGTIAGQPFENKLDGRCADAPTGDLKTQKNPTCEIQTYAGGLKCCRHGQSLLDRDQEIPWPDQYLEYRFKFRFYFQEYKPATATEPASHEHLTRVYWTTEAFAGEYDIPQCSPSTPPDQCIHTITSRFLVRDAVWTNKKSEMDGIKLIYAGPHCHAPTCLSMELYNADTGELLCHVEPIHSDGEEVYYEKGFIAIAPCLWGSPEEGLVEPKFLSMDTTLLSIKRNNSTLPHTGEMASWQMRAVLVPKEDDDNGHALVKEEITTQPENVARRSSSSAASVVQQAVDPLQ